MNQPMTASGVKALWVEFGNVPVNHDGDLQAPFLHFAAGSDREDVWQWFDRQLPEVTVAQLMGVAEKPISQVVRDTAARYLAEEGIEAIEDINNGLCDEFANDVCEAVDGAMPLGFEEFKIGADGDPAGDDLFDMNVLNAFGISLPQGHTPETIERVSFGGHVWIYLDGKHFDAECPEGVDSFFDLPFSRRYLDASGQ